MSASLWYHGVGVLSGVLWVRPKSGISEAPFQLLYCVLQPRRALLDAEDSCDLGPTLRDPSRAVRSDVAHHSAGGMFALRQEDWKLIAGRGSGGWTRVPITKEDPPGQLYHLADDPLEQDNLYNQRPEIVRQLTERLERCRQQGRSRAR